MRNIFKLTLTLSALWFFTSCEEVIDVNLETGETLIAVEGRVTNQAEPHYVKLKTTAPYFVNGATPRVSDINVRISEVSPSGVINFTEQLTESVENPGLYYTTNWAGKTDHNYVLDFEWEGEEYRAESILKRVFTVDSLIVNYIKGDVFRDPGFYITWFWKEPEGDIADYYRFKIYANDTLAGSSRNINILDDNLINGNEIEFEVGQAFQPKDTARIEAYSLTEDNYYFFLEMTQQINNGGLFANPPANVRTNIKNLDPKGRTAVGFFSATGVERVEIIMPEEIPK